MRILEFLRAFANITFPQRLISLKNTIFKYCTWGGRKRSVDAAVDAGSHSIEKYFSMVCQLYDREKSFRLYFSLITLASAG